MTSTNRRRLLLLGLGLTGLTACRAVEPESSELRVLTFNIRYGTAQDGENDWDARRDLVAARIEESDADVLALQEALDFQLEELGGVLTAYEKIGQHREGGLGGEFSGLYVRRGLEITDRGEFWFSESPEVPGSKSWDSSLPRMTAWVDVTIGGVPVRVYGTHYDHRGVEARRRASGMILEHARGCERVVVMGDLNANEEDEPVGAFLAAGYRSAVLEAHPDVTRGTFNGFRDPSGGSRIDHVLVWGAIEVAGAAIHGTPVGERFPSDHDAVQAGLLVVPR